MGIYNGIRTLLDTALGNELGREAFSRPFFAALVSLTP